MNVVRISSAAVAIGAFLYGACGGSGKSAGFSEDPPKASSSSGGSESPAAPLSGDTAPTCNNPQDLTGCPCQPGQTQRCFVGNPQMAGVGACTWGQQTCVKNGEFATWGACSGYGTGEACSVPPPTNFVDAGILTDSASGQGQDAAYCNSGGSVYVNNIVYGGGGGGDNGSPPFVCSGYPGTPSCGPTFGQGGLFAARCAGQYRVCARIVGGPALGVANCNITDGTQQCVTVTVPTDGATVALPAFPGFGPTTNACLFSVCPGGPAGWMSTSLDVVGQTYSGVTVNRPNVAANIDPVQCGGDGNGGSGGGSF